MSAKSAAVAAATTILARTVSLLVDGSALFFGQRAASPDKNLDYIILEEILRRQGDYLWPPKPAYFFTAADEANEKQAKFHQMIEHQLHWTVRQVPPHEASTANFLLSENGPRTIRFDALVAYSLARLAGHPEIARVFVISDSWPLAACVRDCVARGTPVTVCFFGDYIDTRWHKVFRESNAERLAFLDLQHEPRLFNRVRAAVRKETDILNDLP